MVQVGRPSDSCHGLVMGRFLALLELRELIVLAFEVLEFRCRFVDRVFEVILRDHADHGIGLDVIAKFHPQTYQPARRLRSNLGNRVVLDQQNALAGHLVGHAVKHGEHDGRNSGSEERGQVDPGLDRRDANKRIQPLIPSAPPPSSGEWMPELALHSSPVSDRSIATKKAPLRRPIKVKGGVGQLRARR